MLYPVAHVQLRWLSPAEGGRTTPPTGPAYATTAHFAEETAAQLFSVVLRLGGGPGPDRVGTGEAELTLLAPDNLPDVVRRLTPGAELRITEGPRPVAECRVRSVRTVEHRGWQGVLQNSP
jgi:hypothetical protein